MPRGDGTGPMGYGQMTGRQLGYCAGYAAPGYAQGGFGFGHGMGRGRGRAFGGGRGMAFCYGGWGPAPAPGYPVVAPPVNEAVQLKAQIDNLEKTLSALKQRLESVGEESEG